MITGCRLDLCGGQTAKPSIKPVSSPDPGNLADLINTMFRKTNSTKSADLTAKFVEMGRISLIAEELCTIL